LKKEVTKMSVNDLESKIRELRQLQTLIEEATAEAESIKDVLKAHMGDSEELRAGEYKITWKAVKSARIDTKALTVAMPEVAAAFTRESMTRRFVVA
jgi:predicted phage-related endonuclease